MNEKGKTVTGSIKTVALSSAASSKGKNTVKWSKVNGADGYVVYRKAAGTSKWVKLDTVAAKTTYTDTTAKVGKTYSYTVAAYYKKASTGKNVYGKYDTKGVSVKTKK